ncbi:MAG: 4-hydroxy-tetrahydrodipicolinate reductase [Oscillospiraceae bacterium]|nr:4-hydroxy-tetrahydrodipicolinate reductase [Oscillospiraceae bacterium]
MKYIIHGACGRMGRVVQRVFREKLPDADLICVDPMARDGEAYVALADYDGPADCIVDFSHHSLTPALTSYAAARRLPLVIATTGQTPEELAAIREAAKTVPVLFASNFSLGIVVLTALAKQAAKAFPEADIEIVEAHHNRKLDVPSGTALTLAQAVQSVRPGSRLVIGRHENGRRDPADIGVHSLRMGNVVGVHEIHICTDTQTLTLRHEAHDRALFAEGALTAAQWVVTMEPGLYDMQSILNGILQ